MTDKANLIARIRAVNDEAVLQRLHDTLEGDAPSEADEYERLIEQTLTNYDHPPLIIHASAPGHDSVLARFENITSPFMFWYSAGMLVLLSLLVTFTTAAQVGAIVAFEIVRGFSLLYLLLSLISLTEYLISLGIMWRWGRPHDVLWGELLFRLFAALIAPLRLVAPRLTYTSWLWLPRWHWCKRNYSLFMHLTQLFSTPMIIIALLIIPVVLIDYRFLDQMQQFIPNISLYIEIAQSFIWFAFAFELLLMLSVTDEKIDYLLGHWMDVLVVLLPLVYFLRVVRIARVAQGVARVQQLGRLYRFRSVLTKARQAFLLAAVVQRLMHPNPEAQLRSLKRKLLRNAREHKLLEQQVIQAVERLKTSQEKERRSKT